MKNSYALLQVSTVDFFSLGPDVGLGEGHQVADAVVVDDDGQISPV
jgi:hypothetical protein